MTSFFVALALGQVIYGPVSDAVGRRRPILAGLAPVRRRLRRRPRSRPSIGLLIAARFVQGLGAAATAVVPMAVIRDEYTGPDAARLLSLAMLALSVSPILAPVFGGLIVQYTSWRLIFAVLIVICAGRRRDGRRAAAGDPSAGPAGQRAAAVDPADLSPADLQTGGSSCRS